MLGEHGRLLMDAGQMREAIAAFTEVLEISQRLDNPVKVGIALEMLGTIHERQGQPEAALEKYEQALALWKYSSPQNVAIDAAAHRTRAGEDGRRVTGRRWRPQGLARVTGAAP